MDKIYNLFILIILLSVTLGCTSDIPAGETPNQSDGNAQSMLENKFQGQTLTMATTTSTQDSGLLDILNPQFQKETGATVIVLAKGTGAAIQTAIDKEADIIFVHARSKEDEFIQNGYGINRKDVMFNDFVIVGPGADPAEIKEMEDAAVALSRIKKAGETQHTQFFSRGDNSGTHTMEKSLWAAGEIEPHGGWYAVTGKGMGNTLTITNEELGYTITDRGTWLNRKDGLDGLEILVQGPVKRGDEQLMNPYGIIAVNPDYNPEAKYKLAMAYIDFITSPEGQRIIGDYKVGGEQLFFPNAQ